MSLVEAGETLVIPRSDVYSYGHHVFVFQEDTEDIKVRTTVLVKEDGTRKIMSYEPDGQFRNTCALCGREILTKYDPETQTVSVRSSDFYSQSLLGGKSASEYALIYQELYKKPKGAEYNSCSLAEGTTNTLRLSVPSGRIVVKDDLRGQYPLPESRDMDSVEGQIRLMDYMALTGSIFLPVSNTSPSIYETGENSFAVSNGISQEEYGDGSEWVENTVTVEEDWEEVASVCTDLWAVSMADYDDYLSKGGEPVHNNVFGETNVFTVAPGLYGITYHGHEKGVDIHDFSGTLAHMKLTEAY